MIPERKDQVFLKKHPIPKKATPKNTKKDPPNPEID